MATRWPDCTVSCCEGLMVKMMMTQGMCNSGDWGDGGSWKWKVVSLMPLSFLCSSLGELRERNVVCQSLAKFVSSRQLFHFVSNKPREIVSSSLSCFKKITWNHSLKLIFKTATMSAWDAMVMQSQLCLFLMCYAAQPIRTVTFGHMIIHSFIHSSFLQCHFLLHERLTLTLLSI